MDLFFNILYIYIHTSNDIRSVGACQKYGSFCMTHSRHQWMTSVHTFRLSYEAHIVKLCSSISCDERKIWMCLYIMCRYVFLLLLLVFFFFSLLLTMRSFTLYCAKIFYHTKKFKKILIVYYSTIVKSVSSSFKSHTYTKSSTC